MTPNSITLAPLNIPTAVHLYISLRLGHLPVAPSTGTMALGDVLNDLHNRLQAEAERLEGEVNAAYRELLAAQNGDTEAEARRARRAHGRLFDRWEMIVTALGGGHPWSTEVQG